MKLDEISFFVIGAQKSGTTSLHYYLRSHPSICLPKEKEAPYFVNEKLYCNGMQWFIDKFFEPGPRTEILGTVTPQYMSFPIAIHRMKESCPMIKLVAVLRDPIERAISHYRMQVRAFGEQRSFQEVIEEQLTDVALEEQQFRSGKQDAYVMRGEYGRILSAYLKAFDRDQLKIVYSEDLQQDPDSVLFQIAEFLKLNQPFDRVMAEKRNSADGASGSYMTRMAANFLGSPAISRVLRHMLSGRVARIVNFWSITHRDNGSIDLGNIEISKSLERRLALHYLSDLVVLEKIGLDKAPPWKPRIEKLVRANQGTVQINDRR